MRVCVGLLACEYIFSFDFRGFLGPSSPSVGSEIKSLHHLRVISQSPDYQVNNTLLKGLLSESVQNQAECAVFESHWQNKL